MNILENLNKQQHLAVTHNEGPLLIIAGAGTGKTTVITRRIAWLIEQGLAKPDEILALTFTDKAAGEMEERVDQLLPYGYVDLFISTFHSFGERMLKAHALDIGLSNDFTLLSQTEQWRLIQENLDRFDLDYYRPMGNPTKFIHAMVSHFSKCKDEEITPEVYIDYAEKMRLDAGMTEFVSNSKMIDQENEDEVEVKRLHEIANAYHTYQQLLLENNYLDFGDLIAYTLKLFRERPKILEAYRDQFKYILVDEFQDTNWSQYELIKLLAAPKNNLTVVGDDDQSIYKFRGASVSNILTFKNDYPDATDIVLTENYRSMQEILDLSYEFVKLNDPNRLEVKLENIDKKLAAFKGDGAVIEHIHEKTLQDEVRAVVQKIVDLKQNSGGELSWSDFAILIRANASADPFTNLMTLARIPYQFLSSTGLFVKPVILDIVAYLKLLDNYHESAATYRFLNMPVLGMSSQDLMKLLQYSRRKACSLFSAMQYASAASISPEGQETLQRAITKIEKHTDLAREKNTSVIIYEFLKDFEILKMIQDKTEIDAREEMSYLNQFFRFVTRFEEQHTDKTPKKFLNHLDFFLNSGDEGSIAPDFEEGPDTVKIMTIHSSKGLEFEHVFVVNMVDRRFPSSERKDPIQIPDALIKDILPEGNSHLEEERRLFYVAMTRARQGLYFSSADDYGGKRKKKLSRFLYEANIVGDAGLQVDKESVKTTFEGDSGVEVVGERKEKVDIEKILPSKFSFTQIKAYQTCPWQYRYAFILKIPMTGRAVFSFGKTMHSALEKFFKKMLGNAKGSQQSLFDSNASGKDEKTVVQAPSLDELLSLYEESWIDDWYESAEQKREYREKGKAILKEFYKKHDGNWPTVKYLEKGFHLKVGNYTIRGVMDRVDELEDGSIEIIDYKTGAAKTEKTVEKDQLLIYQMAAEDVLGEPVKELTFYYLNDNKSLSFLGTEKQKEKVKNDIVETIEKIKTGNFEPDPAPHKCKYCDFKDICEFRKL